MQSRFGQLNPFKIDDEYDVQDLLMAVLKAYIEYPVQEYSLPKVANTKSGRPDISIEGLGILIEVKYVRKSLDQTRILKECFEDLEQYSSWSSLKHLIYLIYNARLLRDRESFKTISGDREKNGKRFHVDFVLLD